MLRRELLAFAGQSLLLAGCSSAQLRPKPFAGHSQSPITTQFGLQLSTLNQLMAQDFEGTLALVAGIGYQQVEFSAMGLMGREPARIKALLTDLGLRAPVGRVSPKLPQDFFVQPQAEMFKAFIRLSGPDRFIDNVRYSLEVAHYFEQKVINLPAMVPDTFKDIDAVKRNVELLNAAGELCAAEDVLFGYHNHDWEFAPLSDASGSKVVPYEVFLEGTDPEQVTFQLDSYWAVKAGVDWLALLQNNPGRFASCHLKDIDNNGAMADVGEGLIDFNLFIDASKKAGARYFFVERDNPPDPLKTAVQSFHNLQRL